MLLQSFHQMYTTNTNHTSCLIISDSKLVTSKKCKWITIKNNSAGIGVGVSVGVVILVASVLVVVVIASRKSKIPTCFIICSMCPLWLLSYTTPGLSKYVYILWQLLVLLKVIADAVLKETVIVG